MQKPPVPETVARQSSIVAKVQLLAPSFEIAHHFWSAWAASVTHAEEARTAANNKGRCKDIGVAKFIGDQLVERMWRRAPFIIQKNSVVTLNRINRKLLVPHGFDWFEAGGLASRIVAEKIPTAAENRKPPMMAAEIDRGALWATARP